MAIDAQRVQELFAAVVNLPTPVAQAAYLDQHCAGDRELRARVEALLAAHADSGGLLDSPPLEVTGPYVPAEDTALDHAPGTIIAGRYLLEQRIGEGGMGEVWVVRQTEPVKRQVALKLIKPGMDSKAVLQRFEQERQALAVMDHPNIAKVHDAGLTAARRPFFVMELVNGPSLTRFCDEAKLTPQQRLELFIPICQAVQHAHQKGIIHRDLKPSNILVTLIDGRPVPKVIDFGVAKAVAGKLTDETLATNFGAVVGTLEYMAPEQAGFSGQDIDTRADIYSLGVILYELLTGLRPIDSKRLRDAALNEMIRIIREEEPSKPSTRLSTADALPSLAALRQMEPKRLTALLRGDLDWIVMKCLEKERGRRYETANQLAQEVERYLADEPVMASPPGTGYRLRKFVKRHRGPVLAAALVVLALLGGMVGTTWGLVEARFQRDDANYARAKAEDAVIAERAALAAARKRLSQVDKGTDLLGNLFNDLNLDRELASGQSLKLELAKRLHRLAADLDSDLIGDPVVVAKLQHVLGQALRGFGEASQAASLLEKSAATRAALLGERHEATLVSRADLALAYEDLGDFDRALPLLERALRDLEQLGNVNPRTILVVRNNLAGAYRRTKQMGRALPFLEQTLQGYEALLGPDHQDTMTVRTNLATLYLEMGKHELALRHLEAILQQRVATLGETHHSTLISRENVGMSYLNSGKPGLAIPHLDQVLHAREQALPADHREVINARNNLAGALVAAGQADKAVPLFDKTVRQCRAKFGPANAETIRITRNWIHALEQAKRFPEAVTARKEQLQTERQLYPPQDPRLGSTLASLGSALLQTGQPQEAEAALREAWAIRTKAMPNDWRTFNTQSMLGEALLQQGKDAEAAPLLRSGYEGMKQRASTMTPDIRPLRLAEGLQRLVRCCEATGRSAEAIQWRKELEALQTPPQQREKQP